MTVAWRRLPGEQSELYSPIGLRLIDEITGRAPIGWIQALLEASDGGGGWRMTEIEAVLTPGGIVTYPGLERRAEVAGHPQRKYRMQLKTQFYRPWYRATSDGIEFDAYPYNDATPPQVITTGPQDVKLAPAVHYPFAAHIPVLRGIVVDAAGKPVADVEVKRSNTEQVLTDELGTFALPLRWTPSNVAIAIDALDHRTGKTGTSNITLPQALGTNQTITVS